MFAKNDPSIANNRATDSTMKFNQKLIAHVPTQMSYFSGFNFPSMRKSWLSLPSMSLC